MSRRCLVVTATLVAALMAGGVRVPQAAVPGNTGAADPAPSWAFAPAPAEGWQAPSQEARDQNGASGGGGGDDASASRELSDLELARDLLASRKGTSLGPPGGEVRSLAMAPSEPGRLYAGTANGHVYISEDGASSWRLSPFHLGHSAIIDNIVVHPRKADRAWAAFYTGTGDGGLIRTDDGGDTWRDLHVPGAPSLRALALAPSDDRILWVAGIGGVWRSLDGGDSWEPVGDSSKPFQFVESLAIDPRDPDRVYAGTWRQAFRTLDGGRTWRRIHHGMAIDRDVFSVLIDPRDPDRLLAGTCNYIYVSGSGGDSWSERRKGLAADHNRVHVVAHDPTDASVLYAGARGALYRSEDGGDTWNVALSGVAVSAVQVAPEGTPVYVGTEERGVMVSRNGRVFEESNDGLAASRVVAFDTLPGAPRVLFAARSDGTTQDSIHYSTDIGRTWKRLGYGPLLGKVQLIRAQLQPVNRVLVVAERGWWSVAPGGEWYPVDPAPGELEALQIAHDAGGLVVAGTSRGLYVARPGDLGVTDGAARGWGDAAPRIWRPVREGSDIHAVAVQGDALLAAGSRHVVSARLTPEAPADARVPAVEVRAHTETRLPDRVAQITLDPSRPGAAYAVAGHRAYLTLDSGATWETLELPWPAADLRGVVADPTHPGQILALDYRGAVYRGHGGGRYWLVLDDDEGLHRAWKLRVSAQAAGLALVATQGHGLRVVALNPAETATPDGPTGAAGSTITRTADDAPPEPRLPGSPEPPFTGRTTTDNTTGAGKSDTVSIVEIRPRRTP